LPEGLASFLRPLRCVNFGIQFPTHEVALQDKFMHLLRIDMLLCQATLTAENALGSRLFGQSIFLY
jgi:hypothetical protein